MNSQRIRQDEYQGSLAERAQPKNSHWTDNKFPAHQDDLKFPIVTNIQYKQGQNTADSLCPPFEKHYKLEIGLQVP